MGAILSILAIAIIATLGKQPLVEALLVGEHPALQIAVALALSLAYGIAAWFGSRARATGDAQAKTVESSSRLNLAGFNPVWIALAAGVGEELLFRGRCNR